MVFEEWDNRKWKVTCKDDDTYVLHAPSVSYVFNRHDFIELQQRINRVDLFEKRVWFVHDDTIINRRTGEQLVGVMEDCEKLNELYECYVHELEVSHSLRGVVKGLRERIRELEGSD